MEPIDAGSPARRSNPVGVGVLIAVIGLVLAAGLGYLLMWIGSNRLEAARKTAAPYQVALAYVAARGAEDARAAEASLGTNDWGQAQRALGETGNAVTTLEQAATDGNRDEIQRIRTALGDAQSAVGKQDKEASARIADLREQLEALAK